MAFTIDMTGRRALVTGGGQGVGRAISRFLARAGATVVVNDFVLERAEEAVEEIEAAGGDAVPSQFDVTDLDAVAARLGETGPFDIVVNNAGNAGTAGWDFLPFHQMPPDDWDRFLAVNLHGVMHCTWAALPAMIDKGWGRVITIISDAARWGEPRMAPYAAAKAGAAGFTRGLARDVGRFGITVNNVAIATIDRTGATSDPATLPPDEAEARKKQLRSYIVRRLGRPEDVAGMVTYLASDLGSWITGQTYPVNGGYTVNQ